MKTLALALITSLGVLLASVGHAAVRSVVLVHGAFADGSGWKPVADVLRRDGFTVYVVQEPETSFEADVAATRLVLDRSGPCVLVGHSYGGMIITEAGVHPSVKRLVYVAAFQPDVGESAAELNAKKPAAATSIVPVGGGYLQVKPESFPEDFAADVPKTLARFMAISQVPISTDSFTHKVTKPAWKTKPTWYMVATADRSINPEQERMMAKRAHATTVEVNASHVAYMSHPKETAKLIEEAAAHAPANQ